MKTLIIFVFILYSASSLGLEIPYRNNSLVMIESYEQAINFTIPCSDVNEVEWVVDTVDEAKNSIQVESPNKKKLVIEDVNIYNTGVYKCFSKKNPSVFMQIVLHTKIL